MKPRTKILIPIVGIAVVLLGIFVVWRIGILGVYQCTSATTTFGECVYTDKLTLTVDDQWEFLGKGGTYSIHYDTGQLKIGRLRFEGDFPMGDAEFNDGLPASSLIFRGIDGDEIWTRQ